jgi:hypothetical protein
MEVGDNQTVRRDKKPVPSFVGEPFSSIATISTIAGFVFLTISGSDSAAIERFGTSRIKRIRLGLKYRVIFREPTPVLAEVLESF